MDFIKKDTTVTVRLTQEEKGKIGGKAKQWGMTTSSYMKEATMAGVVRKNVRDRKKVVQMVRRQEMLNEISRLIEKEGVQEEVRKAVEGLLEKEAELWQCL